MSIMDAFRGAFGGQQQQQPQNPNVQLVANPNNQGTPGNMPVDGAHTQTAVGTGTGPNGAVPAGSSDDPAKSPLDAFSKLWEPDPNANKNANEPLFNVNMEALAKAAGGQDFLSTVTPETLALIAKGGPDGVKAFSVAMQSASRDVYAKSAFATTKIVEAAIAKAEDKFKASIPNLVKQQNLNETFRTENPALNHPAAQPIINALQQQFMVKYPSASTDELRQMATEYLTNFATLAMPKAKDTGNAGGTGGKKAAETDWSEFLT